MKRLVSILLIFSMIYGIADALERITPDPADPANMVRTDNNLSRINEQYETIEAAILQLYTAEVTIPASTASKTVALSGITSASSFVAIPKTDMNGTITLSITVPSQSITIPSQTVSKPAQAILVPQQYVIKPTQTITFPTLQINITDSAGDTAAVIIPEQSLTSALQYIDVPAQYVTSDAQNITVPSQSVSTASQVVNLPTENAYSKIINVACSTDSITLTRDITLHTAEITVSLVGFK